MLKVTDDGVLILLKQTPKPTFIWRDTLVIVGLCAINGVLAFALHWYSTNVAIILNVFIIILSSSLHTYRKRQQPKMLSGGDLVLSPNTFTHHFLGKTTQYQLTQFDTVKTIGDMLQIANNHKIVYQIVGFLEPKHLEVAHAVLNGKTIATQAKAIKMQNKA